MLAVLGWPNKLVVGFAALVSAGLAPNPPPNREGAGVVTAAAAGDDGFAFPNRLVVALGVAPNRLVGAEVGAADAAGVVFPNRLGAADALLVDPPPNRLAGAAVGVVLPNRPVVAPPAGGAPNSPPTAGLFPNRLG